MIPKGAQHTGSFTDKGQMEVFSDSAPTRHDAGQMLRIFIVEDSAATRDILTESLHDDPRMEIVGFAETEQDALRQLQEIRCDVVILDIHLKAGTGLGVLRGLAVRDPATVPPCA